MGKLEPRNPAIDAIPLVFVALDVEAVTPVTTAESFGFPYDVVSRAFEEAAERGYVERIEDTYRLTEDGINAVMPRGPASIDAEALLEPAFEALS